MKYWEKIVIQFFTELRHKNIQLKLGQTVALSAIYEIMDLFAPDLLK